MESEGSGGRWTAPREPISPPAPSSCGTHRPGPGVPARKKWGEREGAIPETTGTSAGIALNDRGDMAPASTGIGMVHGPETGR